MIYQLNEFLAALKVLRRDVRGEQSRTIGKTGIRKRAEALATQWLSVLSVSIESSGRISPEIVQKYSELSRELLRITGPSNLRSRYIQILDALVKSFRDEIILKLHEGTAGSPSLALLSSLFKGLPFDEEGYMKEAIGCAQKGFLRASIVLAWCAAIHRIHRRIEEIGFPAFNMTSSQMASQQKGRFKRFNQVQNIGSLNELREVFDNIVLWIIEGMGLIDSNQHTRLHSCFEMRCQSAHPGDATVTEFNLLSFYSDLKEIIFDNGKFALAAQVEGQGNPSRILGTVTY